MKKMIYVAALLGIWVNPVAAVTRHDVLECGLSDGSKFILRSAYDWSMVPLPTFRSSRETNRGGWGVSYEDRSGRVVTVPASVDYSGKSRLEEVCANFGMKNGTPLASFTFRQADGNWYPAENFPSDRLDITRHFRRDGEPIPPELQRAGITTETFRFGWIYPQGERLVFEKPLYRAEKGHIYSLPIDAVYQAWSSDGGKSWSDGKVTTDARIFELGRGWAAQSTRARPLSLNGKSVP